MGLYFGSRRCGSNPSEPEAKAPNPRCFLIEYMKQIGPNVVARIRYPNCANFEGLKIVVYRDATVKMISDQVELDPHFSQNGLSPFARFKPTADGWNAAEALACLIWER